MKVLVLSCATYADPSTRKVWDRVAERGVEVTLALPRRVKHPFGPAVVPDTPWPTPGVRLVKLDTWRAHENGTHVIMKGIPHLIRETRPDIIHIVMEPWSITCLEALACIAFMKPRPRFGVQAAETKLDQGPAPAAGIRKALFRQVVRRCDYFIGWSPGVLRAASDLGLNGQPAASTPAVGVDAEIFYPATSQERAETRRELNVAGPGDFLVGFVGRFVPEKGILDLVSAMDRVIARAPETRFVLQGSGPLEPELSAFGSTRPWCRILPPTDRIGTARLMRALDLLVLPSVATVSVEEQFGLVLAEAMASGIPAAGADCGAIPHVIADPAFVFPQHDAGAIADRILTSFRASRSGAQAGTAFRTRSMARFSEASIADQLVRVWEQAR